jgi:outer membrane protein assembly factor BamB
MDSTRAGGVSPLNGRIPIRTSTTHALLSRLEIDSDNVDELNVAWVFPIPGIAEWGGAASSVVIANGIVYFQDLLSNVFALDLETGELVWESLQGDGVLGPNGVAIGYGKVFAQAGVNEAFALDIETGEELWRTVLAGPTGSMAPAVYGGRCLSWNWSRSCRNE